VKSDDLKSLFYVALIGGGAYLAYQAYLSIMAGAGKVGSAVASGASAASSSVADTIQTIVGDGIAQPGGTYTVTMADGSVQTVQAGQSPTPVNGLSGMRRRKIRVRQK
jgi:hypothetical protein